MSESDEQLLRRWAAGDSEAGSGLVRRYFPSVFRFFRNKVGDEVEDLVQQTFEACVNKAGQVRDPGAFRGFVLGVARNCLLMHYRRRAGPVPAEIDLDALAMDRLYPRASPVSVAARNGELALILRAVRKVPINHQIILELRFWEDLSLPEIARILGVPEGTAKSRLSRAKDNLKEVLERIALDPALRQSTVVGLETWLQELRAVPFD